MGEAGAPLNLRGEYTSYLDRALDQTLILVGDLILAEVLQGFRNDADFEESRRALMKFHLVPMVDPWLVVKSAQNFRWLRSKGVTAVRKTIVRGNTRRTSGLGLA